MAPHSKCPFPPYPPTNQQPIDASELLESVVLPGSQFHDTIQHPPLEREPQRLSKLPRYLVGISSKAYFSHAQTITYVHQLLDLPPTDASVLQVFFIPSFPAVSTTSLIMQQRQGVHLAQQNGSGAAPLNLLLGAQECHFAPAGAHTGSVPASELAEIGCSLVELGHAERRRPPLRESDALIAAKAKMAVAAGLVPLVCIGERNHSDDPEDAMREIRPQLDSILQAIGQDVHLILGYEPVWAIGQKEPAPAEYVCQVVNRIKDATKERIGETRILYGGSAKPGIWRELKKSADGLFLGRFAHDVEALRKILGEMMGS
jgi:triosephosphate isomerase (TIM)